MAIPLKHPNTDSVIYIVIFSSVVDSEYADLDSAINRAQELIDRHGQNCGEIIIASEKAHKIERMWKWQQELLPKA